MEVGIDIVEIPRLRGVLARHEAGMRRRVYTDIEWAQCGRSVASLAGRFAAKEAVMKSLGVGGMAFRDIEIVRTRSGKPEVHLSGRMALRASSQRVTSIGVSISHSRDNAVAVAWAEHEPAEVAVPLHGGPA